MSACLATIDPVLERIDHGLAVIGGVVFVIAVRQWRKSAGDPLAGSPVRPNRLTLIWMWIAFLAQFVGNVFAVEVGKSVFSVTTEQLREGGPGVVVATITQIVATGFCLVIAHVTFLGGWRRVLWRPRHLRGDLTWAFGGWLVAIGLCTAVVLITQAVMRIAFPEFTPDEHTVLSVLRDSSTAPWLRYLAISGALILAPVSEELFFRGILQTAIKQIVPPRLGSMYHRWVAIVAVAVLFGLMHWQTAHYVPALIVLGVILGYIYEKRGSLAAPIALHVLFNAKTLLYALISQGAE
jgi:membrane protease YdiL (CAAX protease family)